MTSREDWQRRLGPLYGGAVALVSSTPWRWPSEVADDTRSPAWIVIMGLPIGLVSWAVALGARAAGLHYIIAALLGLAMLTVASAALIERGLGEQIDRWTGTTGSPATTVALVFVTMLRAVAIAVVEPRDWLPVFLATALAGRWAAVFLQALGDAIDVDERSRSLVAIPAPAWLVGAISIAVAVVIVLALGKAGILAIALIALAAFMLGLSAQRREGGLSAPVVAVAAALGELVVLLVATIH